jgi:hypothetical protein
LSTAAAIIVTTPPSIASAQAHSFHCIFSAAALFAILSGAAGPSTQFLTFFYAPQNRRLQVDIPPQIGGNAATRWQPAVIFGRQWYHLMGVFLVRLPIPYLVVSNNCFLQCN